MDEINKPKKSNEQRCGCLIEDLIENSDEKRSNRLCKESKNDLEIFVDPDPEKTSYDFYIRRMTDGLPIIPPTRERVLKFLDYTDRDQDDIIAVLPPRQGRATTEKIAVNSVMAGCMPQFMPIVQHSIEAISNVKFNLVGVNASTHPVSLCTILNGPVSREIGVGSGVGCLGPGNIANATIGRAIHLCLINIAGAIPGIGDHATMGSPAKYSYTFSEAESENPWDALHVERGFKQTTSTITVLAVEAPQNVNDHRSIHAEELLDTIAHTTATAGCNNSHVPGEILVIMSPEHSKTISREGWDKLDVKNYLHENSVVPIELADRGGRKLDENWIVDEHVRITRSPNDVILVVAGGAGRHTMIAHSFGTSSESVTLPLLFKDGTPLNTIKDYNKERIADSFKY